LFRLQNQNINKQVSENALIPSTIDSIF